MNASTDALPIRKKTIHKVRPTEIPDAPDWLSLPDGATGIGMLVSAVGLGVLGVILCACQSSEPLRLGILLTVLVALSGPWVRTAGAGALTVVVMFVLFGIERLSESEAVLIGAAGMLVHGSWRYGWRLRGIEQIFFGTALMTLGVVAAEHVFHSGCLEQVGANGAVRLVFSAATLFLANMAPIAIIRALRDGARFRSVWQERHLSLLLYYMAAAMVVEVLTLARIYLSGISLGST